MYIGHICGALGIYLYTHTCGCAYACVSVCVCRGLAWLFFVNFFIQFYNYIFLGLVLQPKDTESIENINKRVELSIRVEKYNNRLIIDQSSDQDSKKAGENQENERKTSTKAAT